MNAVMKDINWWWDISQLIKLIDNKIVTQLDITEASEAASEDEGTGKDMFPRNGFTHFIIYKENAETSRM